MTHIALTNATIAPLIGGTYNRDEMRIELPSGLRIYIHTMRNNKLRIASGESFSLGKVDRYGRDYPDFPSINCAADKSPETIARDIERRIIAPAMPMLETVRALLDKAGEDRAKLATAVESCPAWLGAKLPSDEKELTAKFHARVPKTDIYLNGRVNAWGSISIDRISSMEVATALRVFAALEKMT